MGFSGNGVKYKPVKRKRHVARPITDLIPHSKHILLTLLEKNDNVNGVFRSLEQTGFNYKRDVLDSMEYLEKAKLITKQAVKNSIRVQVSLTDLGNKIASIMINVEKYIQARSKLDKAITEKFDLPYLTKRVNRYARETSIKPERLVSILLNSGWTAQEINRFGYDNCVPPFGMEDLLYKSPMVIIDLLLHKYRIMTLLVQNRNAIIIIQKIIIDLITSILHLLKFQRNTNEPSEIEQILEQVSTKALYYNLGIVHLGAFMYKFILNEVTDVITSIFSIAEPQKKHIEKRLKDVFEFERKKTEDMLEDAKNHPERWDEDEIYLQESVLKADHFFKKILNELG
jgi:DNA-binding HxlR family transcriptional regulator